MKINNEKQEIIKIAIRDNLAINPMLSVRNMQSTLEKGLNHKFADKYVAKMMYKARRQAVVESDRKKINERLAEVRERHRLLMEDLSRLIYWKPKYLNGYGLRQPNFKERLAAMKLLAHLERSLFQVELHAGVFEDRRLAIEEMLKEGILPTEIREQIVAIFRTRIFRSFRKTEQEMGVIPTTNIIENERASEELPIG